MKGFLLKQSSSLTKLVIAYLVLQFGLAAAMVLYAAWQARRSAISEVEDQLTTAAYALLPSIKPQFFASPSQSLDELVKIAQTYKDQSSIRVTIIADGGTVIVDTDVAPSTMANHANRPEVVQAREFGTGQSTRLSESAKNEFHYLALAIRDGNKIVGFLRLSMATAPIRSRLHEVSLGFIAFVGLSTLLASGLWLWLGRSTVAPLHELLRFSSSIAEGDYRQKLNQRNWSNEWRPLGNAFEHMQTELKKRENDLRENGDRLSAVLANMTEGIVAIDGSRRVLFANRASAILLDVSFQELMHHPFYELVRIATLESAIEEVFQSHRPANVEFEIKHQPKRILTVNLSWLMQSDGEVVVIVFHDVSSIRQLETMRRDFVANVSHELKTPLASIKAYSETLRLGAIDDPGVRTLFVSRIEEQTTRLNDLIMDLIQLARIESGLAAFELNDVDLGQVATERLKFFEVQAESRQLELKLTIDEPSITLRCDTDGLITILDNLISNAVKYTPAGGTVEVRCKRDVNQQAGVIEVLDDGLGIAPEHQERVFERFFRVDKARSRDISGTGLGLSIVKHLVQSFSGQVSLTSKLGKGSCFTVKLPLAEN